jgi:hypothetical protein
VRKQGTQKRMLAVTQQEHYAMRGPELAELNLYEYVACVEMVLQTPRTLDGGILLMSAHSMSDTHVQRMRRKLLIPILTSPAVPAYPRVQRDTKAFRRRFVKFMKYVTVAFIPWDIWDLPAFTLTSFLDWVERVRESDASWVERMRWCILRTVAIDLPSPSSQRLLIDRHRRSNKKRWGVPHSMDIDAIHTNDSDGDADDAGAEDAEHIRKMDSQLDDVAMIAQMGLKVRTHKKIADLLTTLYKAAPGPSTTGAAATRSTREAMCTRDTPTECAERARVLLGLKDKRRPAPVGARPTVKNRKRRTARQKELAAGLYTEQRGIYDQLMHPITGVLGAEPRVFLFQSAAGTGKTHLMLMLIEAIANALGTTNGVSCMSATGEAACRYPEGQTLHTGLRWGRIGKRGTQLRRLSITELDDLRTHFRETRVLIIDEMQMTSQTMLGMIEARLQEIKETSTHNGGLSIILVGDFHQKEPVTGNSMLYTPNPHNLYEVRGHALFRRGVSLTMTELIRCPDVEFGKILTAFRGFTEADKQIRDRYLKTGLRDITSADVARDPLWNAPMFVCTDNHTRIMLSLFFMERYAVAHGLPIIRWRKDIQSDVGYLSPNFNMYFPSPPRALRPTPTRRLRPSSCPTTTLRPLDTGTHTV